MSLLYNVLGGKSEPLTPQDGFLDRACKVCYLEEMSFVVVFASVLAIIFLIDLVQNLRDGPMITEDIWKTRGKSGGDRYVSEDTEKRTKLAVSLVCLEHAILMLIAVFTKTYILLIPWLAVQTLILATEIFLLLGGVVIDRNLPSRKEAALFLLMLYSYLKIWCYYRGLRMAAIPTTTCSIIAPQ